VLARNLNQYASIETLHVFFAGLTADLEAEMKMMIGEVKFEVVIYDIDKPLMQLPNLHSNRGIPFVTFGKMLAASLLPGRVKQVLYLDVDIDILDNIDELLCVKLFSTIAAVPAIAEVGVDSSGNRIESYFSAGVLLINLEKWRENSMDLAAIQLMRDRLPMKYQEQDLLNILFENNYCMLHQKWNFQVDARLRNDPLDNQKVIVHFAGGYKPWLYPVASDLHREWRRKQLEIIGTDSKKWIESSVGYSLLRVYRILVPHSIAKWVRINFKPLLFGLGVNKLKDSR